MSIRMTRNATTKTTKRNRITGGREVVAVGVTVPVANNTNIVGADVSAGNAIAYRGHEHIPVGQVQYDINPV